MRIRAWRNGNYLCGRSPSGQTSRNSQVSILAGQRMEDFNAKLEKLLTEADDCEFIGRLAADPNKRELFTRLAADLRTMARDVEAVIAGRLPEGNGRSAG
jgi:hypothetical protein